MSPYFLLFLFEMMFVSVFVFQLPRFFGEVHTGLFCQGRNADMMREVCGSEESMLGRGGENERCMYVYHSIGKVAKGGTNSSKVMEPGVCILMLRFLRSLRSTE